MAMSFLRRLCLVTQVAGTVLPLLVGSYPCRASQSVLLAHCLLDGFVLDALGALVVPDDPRIFLLHQWKTGMLRCQFTVLRYKFVPTTMVRYF